MGDGQSVLHHQSARVQSDRYLPTRVISPCPLPNAYPPPWPYCFFLLHPFFFLFLPAIPLLLIPLQPPSSSSPYLPFPSLLLPLSSLFLSSLSSSSPLLSLLFLVFLFFFFLILLFFHFFSFSSYSSSFLLFLFLLLFFSSSSLLPSLFFSSSFSSSSLLFSSPLVPLPSPSLTHFLGEFPGLGLALVPDVVVPEADNIN